MPQEQPSPQNTSVSLNLAGVMGVTQQKFPATKIFSGAGKGAQVEGRFSGVDSKTGEMIATSENTKP